MAEECDKELRQMRAAVICVYLNTPPDGNSGVTGLISTCWSLHKCIVWLVFARLVSVSRCSCRPTAIISPAGSVNPRIHYKALIHAQLGLLHVPVFCPHIYTVPAESRQRWRSRSPSGEVHCLPSRRRHRSFYEVLPSAAVDRQQ